MPRNGFLLLDLETVPDPEIPPPDDPEAFPQAGCHQIVSAGLLALGVDGRVVKAGVLSGSERETLVQLIPSLSKPWTWVTWNGRSFDLPVVVARSLRNGTRFPEFWTTRGRRYRYTEEGHIDLKDSLADYGAARPMALDQAARLVGFPGKVGIDGSMVAEMYAAGRQKEIDAYCLCDVVQLGAVLLRWLFIKNDLYAEDYTAAAASLLELVDGDERLAALRPGIQRDRFLLRGGEAEEARGAA